MYWYFRFKSYLSNAPSDVDRSLSSSYKSFVKLLLIPTCPLCVKLLSPKMNEPWKSLEEVLVRFNLVQIGCSGIFNEYRLITIALFLTWPTAGVR